MRAWRRQPSHQLDKGVRGPKAEAFIEYNPGPVLNLQLRPSIYMVLFLRNV